MKLLVGISLLFLYFHPSWSILGAQRDEHLVDIINDGGGLCDDVMATEDNNINTTHMHPLCQNMTPRGGHFKAEASESSPWKIYIWKPEIQQFFTHPIVLGSDDGKQKFVNYMITAKTVKGGHIIGHFEYQWDAIPICCYAKDQNYSREGPHRNPNLLVGAQGVRVQALNQTVLWTAPRHFLGLIFFEATFWKSGKMYWPNVTSTPVRVIKRNLTKHHFNGY